MHEVHVFASLQVAQSFGQSLHSPVSSLINWSDLHWHFEAIIEKVALHVIALPVLSSHVNVFGEHVSHLPLELMN